MDQKGRRSANRTDYLKKGLKLKTLDPVAQPLVDSATINAK